MAPTPRRSAARGIVACCLAVLACGEGSGREPAEPSADSFAAASSALASDLVVSDEYPIDVPVPARQIVNTQPRAAWNGTVGLATWIDTFYGHQHAQRFDSHGAPIGPILDLGAAKGPVSLAANATHFAVLVYPQASTGPLEFVPVRASDGAVLPSTAIPGEGLRGGVASDGTSFLVYSSTRLPNTTLRTRIAVLKGDGTDAGVVMRDVADGSSPSVVGTPGGYRLLQFNGTWLTTYGLDETGTVVNSRQVPGIRCDRPGDAAMLPDGSMAMFLCTGGFNMALVFRHRPGLGAGGLVRTLTFPGTGLVGAAALASGGQFRVLSKGSISGGTTTHEWVTDVLPSGQPGSFALITGPEQQLAVAATDLGDHWMALTADANPTWGHLVARTFTGRNTLLETHDLAYGDQDTSWPAAAAAGDTMFVVWEDTRNAVTDDFDLYARRLSITTGTPIDAAPLHLAAGPVGQGKPTVASDGTDFQAAWLDNHLITTVRVRGGDGTIIGQTLHSGIGPGWTYPLHPALAFGGGSWFLAYHDLIADARYYVQRIFDDGSLGPRKSPAWSTVPGDDWRDGAIVGTPAGAVLVARNSRNDEVRATRIDANGDFVDPAGIVVGPGGSGAVRGVAIAASGPDAVIAWMQGSPFSIRARRLDAGSGALSPPAAPEIVASNLPGTSYAPSARLVDDGTQLLYLTALGAPTNGLAVFGLSATATSDGTSRAVWSGVFDTGGDFVSAGEGRSVVVASHSTTSTLRTTFRALGAPAPAATPLTATATPDVPTPIALPAVPSGVTAEIVDAPRHGKASVSGGTVTYRSDAGYLGSDRLTYRLRRWLMTSAPATIDIDVDDRPPTLPDASITTHEDEPGSTTLRGTAARPLAYRLATRPRHGMATISGSSVRYVPEPDFSGADAFTVLADDGTRTSAPATVTVTVTPVNDAPVATPLEVETDEDTAADVPLAGTDVEGDRLTFVIESAPAHGTVSQSGGRWRYEPARDFNGADGFTYRARDGRDASAPAAVTVHVRPQNDAPVATNSDVVLDEDARLDLQLPASDVDGDALVFTITAPPAHGTLVGAPPAVTYVPAADFHGNDAFSFAASDGLLSAEGRVRLTVRSVNDAPVAVSEHLALDEDTSLAIVLRATDVDGDPLRFTIVRPPSHGRLEGLPPTVRYVPDRDANGRDAFRFLAKDPAGATAEAEVVLDVAPVNDAPVATGGSFATPHGRPLDVVLQAADVDGDALAYAIVQPPAHGDLVVVEGGRFRYLPVPWFRGTDRLVFTASDGRLTSKTAEIELEVGLDDRAPMATPASITTDEDTPVAVTLAGSDPDGDALTVRVVRPPRHGALAARDGAWTYTPVPDFNGADSLSFLVEDGPLASAPAEITIAVAPANDAPRTFDLAAVTAGQPVSVTLVASDPDGDPVTFETGASPAHGQAVVVGTRLTYVPADGFSGEDVVGFVARDPAGASAPGTVRVTVVDGPGPRVVQVPSAGCGCSAGPAGLVALLGLAVRRRRR